MVSLQIDHIELYVVVVVGHDILHRFRPRVESQCASRTSQRLLRRQYISPSILALQLSSWRRHRRHGSLRHIHRPKHRSTVMHRSAWILQPTSITISRAIDGYQSSRTCHDRIFLQLCLLIIIIHAVSTQSSGRQVTPGQGRRPVPAMTMRISRLAPPGLEPCQLVLLPAHSAFPSSLLASP